MSIYFRMKIYRIQIDMIAICCRQVQFPLNKIQRVSLQSELVGILRSLQPATCRIVERLCSDEVVHVEMAVESVSFHLLTVNGIVLLGDVDDIGIRYLKVFDVDLK